MKPLYLVALSALMLTACDDGVAKPRQGFYKCSQSLCQQEGRMCISFNYSSAQVSGTNLLIFTSTWRFPEGGGAGLLVPSGKPTVIAPIPSGTTVITDCICSRDGNANACDAWTKEEVTSHGE